MILLCYDGSADSQAAVQATQKLFAGHPITVLTVWEPYVEMVAQGGFGLSFAPPTVDTEEIDDVVRGQAEAAAREGVELLVGAGLTAEARVEARRGSVASTVLAVADEIDAEAVVLGTRGRTGVSSLLLGSVSHGVVQHADRPVVVIPSETVAAARAARHEHAEDKA